MTTRAGRRSGPALLRISWLTRRWRNQRKRQARFPPRVLFPFGLFLALVMEHPDHRAMGNPMQTRALAQRKSTLIIGLDRGGVDWFSGPAEPHPARLRGLKARVGALGKEVILRVNEGDHDLSGH